MLLLLKKLRTKSEKKRRVSAKSGRDYLPLEIKEALLGVLRLNTASLLAAGSAPAKQRRNAEALIKTQTFEEQAQHPRTHTHKHTSRAACQQAPERQHCSADERHLITCDRTQIGK